MKSKCVFLVLLPFLASCNQFSLESPIGQYSCTLVSNAEQSLIVKANNRGTLSTIVENQITETLSFKWEHTSSAANSVDHLDDFGNCHTLTLYFDKNDLVTAFRVTGKGDSLWEIDYNNEYDCHRIFKK